MLKARKMCRREDLNKFDKDQRLVVQFLAAPK